MRLRELEERVASLASMAWFARDRHSETEEVSDLYHDLDELHSELERERVINGDREV
jgi:hypothetical protein